MPMPRTPLAVAFLLLALIAPRAQASHWRVDPSGSADFTTIQAALDAGGRDTVLVEPGEYAESLSYGPSTAPVVLAAVGGPLSTSIETIVASGAQLQRVRDFTVLEALTLPPAARFSFDSCRFIGEVWADAGGNSSTPHFNACTFLARTTLLQMVGTFNGLTFRGAPLFVSSSGLGSLYLTGCDFSGPADTLVSADPTSGENGIFFTECRFDSAGEGIVYLPPFSDATSNGVTRCVFEDLDGTAIQYDDTGEACAPCPDQSPRLSVTDSRIERSGGGIVWLTGNPSDVGLVADTLRAIDGDGVVLTPVSGGSPPIHDLILEGGTGHGLWVRASPRNAFLTSLDAANLDISGFALDGVRMESIPTSPQFLVSVVRNSMSHENGGDGFNIHAAGVTLSGNVAWGNGGHGIALTSEPVNPNQPDSVLANTCADNGGDGIVLDHGPGGAAQAQIVQRNLAAGNAGAGIRAPAAASVAYNDAWNNLIADYSGVAAPTDSNLVADPLFCDAAAHDYTVQASSPCAPGGVYGPIGAMPVACPTASVDPLPDSGRLRAAPNPFRGSLAFTAPADAGGLLEVFDPQGRRLWSRTLRAAERAEWDGVAFDRPIAPGIYLARFESAAGRQTVRVVRID